MGANYKVLEVVSTDNYSFPDKENPGQMVFLTSYEMKVSGPATQDFDPATQTAKQDRKVDSDPPKPGEDLFVDAVKNKRGDIKLRSAAKRDRDRTPMDSAPQPGQRQAGYRQQDPPEVVARIGRAHAQQMAIALIEATGGEPDLDLTSAETENYLNHVVARLTSWFAADVDKAGKAVENEG